MARALHQNCMRRRPRVATLVYKSLFETFSAGQYRLDPERFQVLPATLRRARRFAADFPRGPGCRCAHSE